MEKMEFTVMKFPWMREELLDYLEGLGNLSYQQACWVDGICPEGVEHDELDYAIHFLFDDTDLGSAPENCIGIFLQNMEEAISIKQVCDAIDSIFKKYGTKLTDAEYIGLAEWKNVIAAAQSALHVLGKTQ
jgi:hypothetical protein